MEPVKVLFGSDSYTKDLLEDRAVREVEKAYGGCEVFKFDGLSDTASDLLDELLNISLFSPAKVLILRNAEKILDNEFKAFLKEYSKKENITSFLIIELDKMPAALRALPSQKLDPPYENKMPDWILSEASSKNINMSRDAAELLFFYCGRDLRLIVSELKKLSAAFPEKKLITVENVKSVASSHFSDDMFGYIDALIDGDKKALLLLENLLKYNTEPLNIAGALKWKLQQMLTVRMLMNKGGRESDIIKKAALRPPFMYRGFCRRVERFSLERLLQLYDELQKTDLKMKSLPVGRRLLIEEFSFKFLNG